jgi:peptidoglycan hydrolase CwlO-like protein
MSIFPIKDLEDWDVVGLNRSKPPSIITLYRYYYNKQELNKEVIKKDEPTLEKIDFSTQISFDNDLISNQNARITHLNEKQSFLISKIEKLQSEIDNLNCERECLLKKIDLL